MKMTNNEKKVYEMYANRMIDAIKASENNDFNSYEFYMGEAYGIKECALALLPCNILFLEMLSRVNTIVCDFVAGVLDYVDTDIIYDIKEGRI